MGTNLVFGLCDYEDDLEILALLQEHLATFFISPPIGLKRVEHKFLIFKARVEMEGNVSRLTLATGKVHPESGRERRNSNRRFRNLRVEFLLFPPTSPLP